MKRKLFALVLLALVMTLPALAQVEPPTEDAPAWAGTLSMLVNAVLVILSTILGAKWYLGTKKVKEGADKVGGIFDAMAQLMYEIKVTIAMVPEVLKDKNLTEAEIHLITLQLQLLVVKLKAVLSYFKKKGLTD